MPHYPHISLSPSDVILGALLPFPSALLVFSTTRRECYLKRDQEICLK